jgi:hypothetical protein
VKTINVCKALPVNPEFPTEDATIVITGVPPSLQGTNILEDQEKADTFFRSQSEQIAEALRGSLPGGTFDRLVVRLLDMRSSQLQVAHRPPKELEKC